MILGFNRAENACLKKRRFASEMEARHGAQGLILRGKADRPELFVYACRFCGGWHFTKRHDDPRSPGVTALSLHSRTVRYSVAAPRSLSAAR